MLQYVLNQVQDIIIEQEEGRRCARGWSRRTQADLLNALNEILHIMKLCKQVGDILLWYGILRLEDGPSFSQLLRPAATKPT